MTFYFLVLASLLNLDNMAPRIISPHASFDDCAKAAAKANTDPRLLTDESQALALRFVCLKLVPDA